MKNPYEYLEQKYFWSTAIAKKNMFDIEDLFLPKFDIQSTDKIATFGSCFAQHIGKALKSRGFEWMNYEPAPGGLSEVNAKKYNYGIFSARTGNIYTASLLLQWVNWAIGDFAPPEEIWEVNGQFYDPFRPGIEPEGFESIEELKNSREKTIRSFKKILLDCDVFVFTLGLTESWVNNVSQYEYAVCPGTVAGKFDQTIHSFSNQDYEKIKNDLSEAIRKIKVINTKVRFLLTVSPVPLTATMSGNHVLVATIESKSILRAVAGNVSKNSNVIDYFPSFEIITGTPFRGTFFEPNQRGINPKGVEVVMSHFFSGFDSKYGSSSNKKTINKPSEKQRNTVEELNDVVCEEELLDAFKPTEFKS